MSEHARRSTRVRLSGTRVQQGLRKRTGISGPGLAGGVRALKVVAQPLANWRRRRLARPLRGAPDAAEALELGGFHLAPAGSLPGAEPALACCRELLEKRGADAREGHRYNPDKDFLLSMANPEQVAQHPELLSFLVSRPLLDLASGYLGAVPLLASVHLWWSPPNQTELASQRFHIDKEDARQLKLLLNVTETGEENGPFTFLPAPESVRVRAARRKRRHHGDEHVFSVVPPESAIRLSGPAGSGGFVDTSRCLHYGSRGNRLDRFVLQVQYLRLDSPFEATIPFELPALPALPDLDPVQRLALGFA